MRTELGDRHDPDQQQLRCQTRVTPDVCKNEMPSPAVSVVGSPKSFLLEAVRAAGSATPKVIIDIRGSTWSSCPERADSRRATAEQGNSCAARQRFRHRCLPKSLGCQCPWSSCGREEVVWPA